MIDTVSSSMTGVAGELTRSALNAILRPIADRMSSQATTSAGLVISATTTKAKTGAVAFAGVAKGVPWVVRCTKCLNIFRLTLLPLCKLWRIHITLPIWKSNIQRIHCRLLLSYR